MTDNLNEIGLHSLHEKPYKKSLVIFRRDLRLQDNTALCAAAQQSAHIIPCFIFDPRQVGKANAYKSSNALQFMIESLKDLEQQLKKYDAKLYIFFGKAESIVKKIIEQEHIDAVFCNKDYTPFSINRDEEIEHACIKEHVIFNAFHDALLIYPEEITTSDGTPYSIFTAFYKKASKKHKMRCILKIDESGWYKKPIDLEEPKLIYKRFLIRPNKNIQARGGHAAALKIVRNLSKFTTYTKTHDYPALETTHLSAHLKFGTISVRELYQAIEKKLGAGHQLIRQLFWRDFFTYVAYNAPFVFGSAYHEKYNAIVWENDKHKFKAWCEGNTGFPIIDAGMRQLNKTGYMHNRVRMLVASFLVKDLHIDWQWGEKYFAQHLVDYDPSLNNGNWQWVASTGCDAQPYFRIFNPWLQQKKFDPACKYIKKWVPELKKISPLLIHSWHKRTDNRQYRYPRPIVDHAQESEKAKKMYRKFKI